MKLNKNVSVEIRDNTIYLHLRKHIPIIINAEDKYRKGVEIDICDGCGILHTIILDTDNKKYCDECGLKHMMKDVRKISDMK